MTIFIIFFICNQSIQLQDKYFMKKIIALSILVFESVFYSKEQPEEHVLMMIMMMMLRTIIIMYLFLFSSLRAARRACIADGSCPEFTGFNPDLHAEPTQCVDGIANGYPCRNINLSSFRNFVDLGSVR